MAAGDSVDRISVVATLGRSSSTRLLALATVILGPGIVIAFAIGEVDPRTVGAGGPTTFAHASKRDGGFLPPAAGRHRSTSAAPALRVRSIPVLPWLASAQWPVLRGLLSGRAGAAL